MTFEQELSQKEKDDLIEMLGQELRERLITESEFRRRIAKLGCNATESDSLVQEALKPT